jgi:hypothetical protein
MSGIFISHTHGDHAVADALTALVEALFGARVGVSYSTKKELEGGIASGVLDDLRSMER